MTKLFIIYDILTGKYFQGFYTHGDWHTMVNTAKEFDTQEQAEQFLTDNRGNLNGVFEIKTIYRDIK